YGVDERVFEPQPSTEARAQLDLPAGILFICAGRLAPDKATYRALDAFALLAGAEHDPRLLVVGDGPERTHLERQAAKLGLTESVHFAGAQPPARMPLYFAAADALLLPTERDEG